MLHKFKCFILVCSLLFVFSCQTKINNDTHNKNLLQNGGFENWSENLPLSWPVIDKGITLNQEKEIVEKGTSSARINVLTDDQSATDFRQSIDVRKGESYTLSVWIYHTQGYVLARIFIDGYQLYSDNNLINEWQMLTFNYRANTSKRIDIGLRFYTDIGFEKNEYVYIDDFTVFKTDSDDNDDNDGNDDNDDTEENIPAVTPPNILATYYKMANDKEGFALKTALYNIIKDQKVRSYSDLWTFMAKNSRDLFYEKDHSILDMYSENPVNSDAYSFSPEGKCGNYQEEGDCYNREHSFPKSWFGGKVSPMYTDIHHIFATDGYVNSKRSRYPYGETRYPTWTSTNGSQLGPADTSINYKGTIFEPIDEFKGDFARAYFYMATRYENIIATWKPYTDEGGAVLDGTKTQVFQPWVIELLTRWNENDPVSLKEQQRNKAAFDYQGNRNPYIDHPEYINKIWSN